MPDFSPSTPVPTQSGADEPNVNTSIANHNAKVYLEAIPSDDFGPGEKNCMGKGRKSAEIGENGSQIEKAHPSTQSEANMSRIFIPELTLDITTGMEGVPRAYGGVGGKSLTVIGGRNGKFRRISLCGHSSWHEFEPMTTKRLQRGRP